jgi:ubiquinone/menaquinone biosynthesis C-methylase UbiE
MELFSNIPKSGFFVNERNMKLGYDPLAQNYDQRYIASPMRATVAALLSLAQKIHPKRVLEAGCGTRHWLAVLTSHGYATFGLDFSAVMLAQARDSGTALTHADAISLPFAAL